MNQERKKQKLSIAQLADKANLPKATVEKFLFGIVKNPRIDTITAIERALGIELNSNELYSSEEKNLVLSFRSLPEGGKDAVIRLIKSYLE